MKKSFLNFTYQFLLQNKAIQEKDKEKILYGLEGLYLTVTKLILLFVLSFFFSITKELIILLLLFQVLRFTGFGFHASTSFECFVLSILFFIILPIFFFYTHFSLLYYICFSCLSCLCFFLYAPADTIKRPLRNKNKRLKRKVITILIGILYTFLSILFYPTRLSTLFLLALMIEAINVHPALYYIFHESYQNYHK